MSLVGIFCIVLFLITILSQFGKRLQARNSLAWWGIAFLILVATIEPESLRVFTDILGIKLISNFILAASIAFLFLHSLDVGAEATSLQRKLRSAVSTQAAEAFIRNQASSEPFVDNRKRVLIVLPCFNEEKSLIGMIVRIKNTVGSVQSIHFDYCFVDDGSTDDSRRILKKECIRAFTTHTANLGVSGVIMTGCKVMLDGDYDYLVQCDGDGQHPVEEIGNLTKFAISNNADLTIGSRFFNEVSVNSGNTDLRSTSLRRYFGIRAISFLLRFFGVNAAVSDPTSGFRVYSRKACKMLIGEMPDEYPEPESIALMAIYNYKICERRVIMQAREFGESSLAGLKSIRYMLKVTTALAGLRLRTIAIMARS